MCPRCQNYVAGQANYTYDQKAVRHVAKKGINWGLKGVIVIGCTFVTGFLGFGVGAIPGFIVGIIIACFCGNSVNESVDAIGNALYDSTEYIFSCPKCGYTWKRTIKNSQDTDSDELLSNLQTQKVEELKNEANGSLVTLVITLVLGIWGVWYWTTHSFQDSLMTGILLLMAASSVVIAIIGFISSVSSYSSKSSMASEVENMTVDEFRGSKYRFDK